jgi:GT2 family glycosyltransferase
MSVSIITVAYRSGNRLLRLLDSLGHEDVHEVLVVDNDTGGPEIDEAARRPRVRVLDPPRNLGFTGGANLGAREASGDVLVFLNPDTVVTEGSIAKLVRALGDRDVGIAMASLRLLEEPGTLNSSGTVVHVTGIGWAGGYGDAAESDGEVHDVAAPSGAAMAVRAETFHALGGFADELFMYIEDLELGWRARVAGYRVVLVPDAEVLHEYEYGRNPQKSYLLERNRLVFVLSSYSGRLLVLLGPLLFATELGMAVLALKEGWLRDKVSAWGWLARNAGTVGRRRRSTQGLRKVRDRELASWLTPVFDPKMIPAPGLLKAANPLVERYWSLVRRAL